MFHRHQSRGAWAAAVVRTPGSGKSADASMAAPRGAWTSCTSYQVIAAPWSRCKRRNGGAFSGNGASVARESESPRPVATMVQTDDEDELHPGGEPSAVPSGSEADPFSDGDALDGEEEDGEDLHEEGRAVPMGCVRVCDSSSLRPWLLPCAPPPASAPVWGAGAGSCLSKRGACFPPRAHTAR